MPYRQLALEDIPETHPVAAFSRFWSTVATGGGLVSWSVFDPTEHRDVLPWLLLLKRSAEADAAVAQSWYYAVCGTGCTQLFGRSSQGKVFGDGLPASAVAERLTEIGRLVAGSGPLYSHTHVPIEGRDFVQVIRGAFPFTVSGQAIDCVLFVIARENERMAQQSDAAKHSAVEVRQA